MLYMIVEQFRGKDPRPVYKRFAERGRMAPPNVQYVASWVDTNFERCFQLMEAPDSAALEVWLSNWRDIVGFEYWPVITSAEAVRRVAELRDSENDERATGKPGG